MPAILVLFPLIVAMVTVAVVGFRRRARARERAVAQICLGIALFLAALIGTDLDPEPTHNSLSQWIPIAEGLIGVAIIVPQLVRILFRKL